nr:AMP-dependent synthetase/ligase [uncultured Flavobacterium sp.]
MKEVSRLFDFPYYQLATYPLQDAIVSKQNGSWIKLSTQEYINQANSFSRGLLELGVQKGDKIALITSNNRIEWNVCDIGALQLGALTVPIYPTISAEDYQYIIEHSESKYCIVSDVVIYEKLKSVKHLLPNLKEIYSFEPIEGCKSWKEILEMGNSDKHDSALQTIKDSITASDNATIIYTSGTTGKPKGVLLTHDNIVSNALMSFKRVPLKLGEHKALSFLPCCHIFERMLLYLYQYCGIGIYYAESIETISDNLKEVKPHVMTVVPRLVEKVYDKIYAKGADLTGIKKKLFFWSIELGEKYEAYGANGFWYNFQLGIARKLIFSKWHEGLGGNLELMVSGSAPLQARLARVFSAAGIPIMEGYGLTETSPVIAVNDERNFGLKYGSVGKPLDGLEVKIAEDGEILVKGPSVMKGYYKDEEKTAEVFVDGYFCTGDIGNIDAKGFLTITDRKKEMFKTSGGKYVAPQVLENSIKQSRFIEQVMVIGDGEKMPAAFIQPSFDFIKEWAIRKNLNVGQSLEEISQNQNVIDRIQIELDAINKKFGKWEQVKRFELTPTIWSIDGGELTPTLKLKRKIIKEKYQNLYDKIYRN